MFFPSARKTHFQPIQTQLNYWSLEPRRLLAGDVLFFQQGSFLRVVGDDQDNVVEISQNDAGQTVVTGFDTSINGQSAPQVIDSNRADNMTVALKSGNDNVSIKNVFLTGNVRLLGNDGDDRISADGFASRYLHIDGHHGNDVVQLTNTTIVKSTYVFGGQGDDVVAVESFVSGRNFKVYSEAGDDTFAAGDIEVGRKFRVNLDKGNDEVLLVGQTEVARSTKIRTGDGDDFAGILPNRNEASAIFEVRLVVDNGPGDDATALDDNVNLRSSNRTDGGSGFDSIHVPADAGVRSNGFEANVVENLDELIDRVFRTLDQAGIESSLFDSSTEIELTVSDTSLNFTEGDDAIAIDESIEVIGPENQLFTSATIAIDGFAPGQDFLSLDGNRGISGEFDVSAGILSLTGTDNGAVYQDALRNVRYENTSENPVVDERQLVFTLTTGDEEVAASRTLQVVAINDAPIIDLSRNMVLVSEVASPVVIDDQLELSDIDSPLLNSAVVSITQGFEPGIDELAFEAQNGIIGTFDPTTGALTFVGDATVETYESLLRSITIEWLELPATNDRNIRFTINDGELFGFDDLEVALTSA